MKKKKNILIVTSSYPRYENDTAGVFIHNLNKKLSKYYDIIVLSPFSYGLKKKEVIDDIVIKRFKQFPNTKFGIGNSDKGMFETIKENPFKVFILITYLYYLLVSSLQIIKKHNIDNVHFHWIFPNGLILPLIKLFHKNIKYTVTVHGSDYWAFNRGLKKNIKLFLLKKFDSVIYVSNAMLKDVEKKGFYHHNSHTISMGIEAINFSKKDSNKNNPNFNILFVGKANKAKGFDVLTQAILKLNNSVYNLNVQVIGQSIENELINDIKNNNLISTFDILGKIPNNEINKYYQSCDLFVLPSLSEGWPVVVMEALASGCICIVTDIPVFEEYKDKYEFLHVVEKGNSEALAKKIKQILDNYDYFLKFKKDAREYAVKNFDWNVITDRYNSAI